MLCIPIYASNETRTLDPVAQELYNLAKKQFTESEEITNANFHKLRIGHKWQCYTIHLNASRDYGQAYNAFRHTVSLSVNEDKDLTEKLGWKAYRVYRHHRRSRFGGTLLFGHSINRSFYLSDNGFITFFKPGFEDYEKEEIRRSRIKVSKNILNDGTWLLFLETATKSPDQSMKDRATFFKDMPYAEKQFMCYFEE